MSKHGSFSGNPKTEWLVDENGADRDMALIEEFWYLDPGGRKWAAPKGSVINGASMPRPLWSTVGSPYTDDYRRASIVHDVAYDDPTVQRKDADIMFYFN
jgi:choline dehydrogenase-like flavoprotein